MRYVALAIAAWMVVGLGLYTGTFKVVYNGIAEAASVFFVDSSTPDILHKAYKDAQRGRGPFKLLIVPGHDTDSSGTSYGGLSEADLTLATAKLLAKEFEADPNIEVRVARNDGGYNADLGWFFVEHRQDIIDYRNKQAAQMRSYLSSGDIASDVGVNHNFAPSEVALKLYGINLWANQNGYDLVIHIHFNDIPRANRARPGPYTGFAIYVPEHQFSNAKGSMAVGEAIKERLLESFHVSTLPLESVSPTEDQELIAIGSNNSLDASSVLIEYGYIYEQQIQDNMRRNDALLQMTHLTYEGVEDFLTNKTAVAVQ